MKSETAQTARKASSCRGGVSINTHSREVADIAFGTLCAVVDMHRPFAIGIKDIEAFLGGLPVDAARLIRPGRPKAQVGFWKRLLGAGA